MKNSRTPRALVSAAIVIAALGCGRTASIVGGQGQGEEDEAPVLEKSPVEIDLADYFAVAGADRSIDSDSTIPGTWSTWLGDGTHRSRRGFGLRQEPPSSTYQSSEPSASK